MPINIEMPRLSDTMEVGTVVKWNVKEGDTVSSGDVIADIETDKATMELQAFDDGTVASIPVSEGQQVAVGTVIIILAEEGEDVASAKSGASSGGSASSGAAAESAGSDAAGSSASEPSSTATAEPPSQSQQTGKASPNQNGSAPSTFRVFASPLARKLARDNDIDLATLSGTGPSGRIVKRDVEQALSDTPPRTTGASQPAAASAGKVPGAAAPHAPSHAVSGAGLAHKVIPLSGMRTTIAKRLVESKSTIPHYQVTTEAQMDNLLALRKQLNAQLEPQGVKLSVNDFLVRACALAMHDHPFVNSRWVDDKPSPSIEILPDVNIGVAIAIPINKETLTGGGLVVATLRNADRLGLRHISDETKRLANKAREKGLSINEMSDSTFTISNLGMFGVDHFTAIINPPNAAILAVGRAAQRAVFNDDGSVRPATCMSMTMSSDHRIVDGAMAAQYLQTVKDLLESPAAMLV